MHVPRPNPRRLLRMSLRTAFVLTTILCIWLGFRVHQVTQQKEAVASIEKQGGSVYYDYESDLEADSQIPNPTPPGPAWLRDLIGHDYFSTPVEAYVTSSVNDLSELAHLSGLVSLHLSNDETRDLSPLAKLQRLKTLYLECRRVRDLSPLAELRSLRGLTLESEETTDLSPLAKLQNMTDLYLDCPRVDDLSPLAELHQLEFACLATAATEEEIAKLRKALPDCCINAG